MENETIAIDTERISIQNTRISIQNERISIQNERISIEHKRIFIEVERISKPRLRKSIFNPVSTKCYFNLGLGLVPLKGLIGNATTFCTEFR